MLVYYWLIDEGEKLEMDVPYREALEVIAEAMWWRYDGEHDFTKKMFREIAADYILGYLSDEQINEDYGEDLRRYFSYKLPEGVKVLE